MVGTPVKPRCGGRGVRCVVVMAGFLCVRPVAVAWAGVAGSVAEGNRAYRAGRYDEALERYWSAEVRAPDSPIVNFNIGNALHKQGKSDPAMQAWRKALHATRDRALQSDILSNMGTAALRAGNRDEAVGLFAEALRRNPKNIRARYNLLQARISPPQTSQGSDRQNQDGTRENTDRGTGDERQRGNDRQNQDAGRGDRQQMTREDVQRLLEMNEQQQQNLRQRQARPAVPVIPETDRDW
jgi:tetratricopeptide (TPR) repeat protein